MNQIATNEKSNGKGLAAQAAVALAPRKKSKETELKLQMRKINRELVAVEKKVDEFEAMKKEMDGAGKRKETLVKSLETVKAQLIKELGLA